MKSIKLFGFAICIFVFIACNDNRTAHGTDDRNRTNQTERVGTDQRNQNANQRNQGASNTAAQNNQSAAWGREMTQLYSHLNMDRDQINSYERMQRENRSQATTTGTGQNQSIRNWETNRDQSLRNILTQEQYQRYEQWKRDNQNQNRNTNY